MAQITAVNQFNRLQKLEYNTFRYTRNKAELWKFLQLVRKNDEGLDSQKIGQMLKKLQPVINKLRQNQKKIHAKKGEGKKITFLHHFWLKVAQIIHLFQQVYYGAQKLDDLTKLAAQLTTETTSLKHKDSFAAVNKFITLVKKVQQTIAVGKHVKGTVALDKDYWLEALGMRLVLDGETFEGHLYTGYFIAEQKYLEKWKNGYDSANIPYPTKFSFEEYMNAIVIPQLSPQEKEAFKSKLSIVEYFTSIELTSLEAHFDLNGRIFTESPALNAWIDHKAKHPDSKQSYHHFHRRFLLKQGEKKRHFLKDQTYLGILDHQGRLLLHIKERGKINHSSLSNGHAVLAAVSIKVKDREIIAIDTFSGHYKPTELHLETFLKFLKTMHVNLAKVKLTYVGNYDVQPWKIHEINPPEVLKWMAERSENSSN